MDISIKKPCHENWSDMTPNEQGAFCGKCVKSVIDFSQQSIEEIKSFFSSKQETNVCGRFEKQQLRALSFDAFFTEFKGLQFTKRFAVILYFTFGLWLFGSSEGQAQNNDHIKGDVAVVEQHVTSGMIVVKQPPTDTIKPAVHQEPMIMGKIAAPKTRTDKPVNQKKEIPATKTATISPAKKDKPKRKP